MQLTKVPAKQLTKVPARATWWEGSDDETDLIPPNEDVELRISFEDEAFYIDGLREGHYLSLPLAAIACAIAENTVD
jgi:hypothetical protein